MDFNERDKKPGDLADVDPHQRALTFESLVLHVVSYQ